MDTIKVLIRVSAIGLLFLALVSEAFAQSKIKLRSNHPDAEYFRLADFSEENPHKIGVGSVDLKLEKDSKNRVLVTKLGFEPVISEFPRTEKWGKEHIILLENRMVQLEVDHADATITYGEESLIGNTAKIIIPKNETVTLQVAKQGFVPQNLVFHNKRDMDQPPVQFANSRMPLSIKTSISSSDAWKILISIITREFDVLETVDFNAGYLISAWEYDEFNKGDRTIRNRVIVTNSGSTQENNYSVKFVSQLAEGKVDVRDDTKFKDWNRMLKKYHELIDEIELRLQ
jgi:hypothetical protein